ncbi:KLC1 [Branchiostoma lanceolatum]|uniref:KLC1 protein n=1 Tax=Branchiostoma lanceolatum TaxID=7740 RepID=A0A8J9VTE0_BRALA|nr:KLC1 [Branchiostoma lanceolatum]
MASLAQKLRQMDSSLQSNCSPERGYGQVLVNAIADMDTRIEAEALKCLGDLFLEIGKRTKSEDVFDKAAAMYTACVRIERRRISRPRGGKPGTLLQQAVGRKTKPEVKQGIAKADVWRSHRNHLQQGGRAVQRGDLDMAEQHFASALKLVHQSQPLQLGSEADCLYKLGGVYIERGKVTKDGGDFTKAAALYNAAMARSEARTFRDMLIQALKQTEQLFLRYAFIGLGSQATELVTPFSDLEFAILIEDGADSEENRQYFRNLTHYLHLKIINLGETILPAMGIKSLNDFYSDDPEGSWFYDSITPRGLAFDGSMPWASKTPFGRQRTKDKPPLELIQTPGNMAKFQKVDIAVAEGYHLARILRSACHMTGDEALVEEYMDIVAQTTHQVDPDGNVDIGHITSNIRDFGSQQISAQLLSVKKEIYRFPAMVIQNYAFFCGLQTTSMWNTVEQLKNEHLVSEDNAHHLAVLVGISVELRLRTYLASGSQRENISALKRVDTERSRSIDSDALDSVFYIPNRNMLFRYYYSAEPLRKIALKPNKQQKSMFLETTIFDASSRVKGVMQMELCDFKSARQELETALKDVTVNKTGEYEEIVGLLVNVSYHLGDHKTVIQYSELLLETCRRRYRHGVHPNIAASLNNIGSAWSAMGDEQKAINFFQQALDMRKLIHGRNAANPDIASLLHNLGDSWKHLGDYKKALGFCEEALGMRKRIFGEDKDHPDIAISLKQLGEVWRILFETRKAISFYEQALKMFTRVYGQEAAHPDIADTLNELGNAWRDLGDYNKAINFLTKGLHMFKLIHGQDEIHDDITNSLNDLGNVWRDVGDYRKSIDFHKKALRMYEHIYGNKAVHPNNAKMFNNLGCVYLSLGDYRQAIMLFEKALAMTKLIYGPDSEHPDIIGCVSCLGTVWDSLGDHRKAISFYEQVLRMQKRMLGENEAHPDIAASLSNLGTAWAHLSDDRKAVTMFDQALKIQQIVYGENAAHPEIVGSLTNLGASWILLGDHRRAIDFYERALRLSRLIYGVNAAHPDIARILNNIGKVWGSLGEHKKAIDTYEHALNMRRTIHGRTEAHPDMAVLLTNLGDAWVNLGDHRKSIQLYEEALDMSRRVYGSNAAHSVLANILSALGNAWSKTGDSRKGNAFHEQARAMKKVIHEHNAPMTENTL